jgi:hypothetical protein
MEIVEGAYKVRYFILGDVGGAEAGDLMVYSAGTAIKATDPISAGTMIGVLLESGDQNDLVPIAVPEPNTLIRAPYTGSSKTSLADTDIGTAPFDLSDENTIDLDDTTEGCAICQDYDNDNDTIDFVVPQSFYYI